MTLTRLSGREFRCFESFDIHPDSRLNLIVGANGAGKTSLLEAIYVLGRGRSFRTSELRPLRRHGTPGFVVAGGISRFSREIAVRVESEAGRRSVRIGGSEAGLAALAELLPVQIIEPGAHKLIEDGPARRRRFLDWGVFHVEPQFLDAWRRCQRALRQRNAGLKQGASDVSLRGFEAMLADAGEAVGAMRSRHVDRLKPLLESAAQALLGERVDCHYMPGWPAGQSLGEAIDQARAGDRRYQTTRSGPQRADLQLSIAGKAAREWVSRGEQKLLAASLILAQVDLLGSIERTSSLLLVDDPAAELDRERLERLLGALLERPAQVFLTSLEGGIPHLPKSAQLFHVKQGKVTEML